MKRRREGGKHEDHVMTVSHCLVGFPAANFPNLASYISCVACTIIIIIARAVVNEYHLAEGIDPEVERTTA